MVDLTELKENIEKNYKLRVRLVEKNYASTDGNVYMVECKEGIFVAKIYEDLDHTNSMWDLHRYLTEMEFYVPKVIKTKSKTYYMKMNEYYVVIYSYLVGKSVRQMIRTNKFNDETIALIARQLRRFHFLTQNKRFNLPESPFSNKLRRRSVLHHDLTKDNILVDLDKVGFIDFDDAQFGDSACDIAIAILFLFVSVERGVDNHAIKVFVESYYGNDTELFDKEKPLIKEYADEWVKYMVRKGILNDSMVEIFKFKRRLIKNIDILKDENN